MVLPLSMLLNLDWGTHRTCLVGLCKCLLGVLTDIIILSGKTCLVSLVAIYTQSVGWFLLEKRSWTPSSISRILNPCSVKLDVSQLIAVWTWACLPCCVVSGTCSLCGLDSAVVTRPSCLHYFVFFLFPHFSKSNFMLFCRLMHCFALYYISCLEHV